jgi:hypothetical protein
MPAIEGHSRIKSSVAFSAEVATTSLMIAMQRKVHCFIAIPDGSDDLARIH